jgi:glucosamine-6-phosphate deaminase
MGKKAAEKGAEEIRWALGRKGEASIVVATGASQFEMLGHLVRSKNIDWSKVTAFHLDEYIGIPQTHKASFRKYLKERFVEKLPGEIGQFHYIQAENKPQVECQRLGRLIRLVDLDVAFIGIGENGHIAFNDPPADFETEDPYIVVQLDEACRRQQMGEGWFSSLSDVPEKAISMSVRQIMKSNTIVCTVPDARKADAVRKTLEEPVTPQVPATKLQEHPDCHLFLDQESAGLIRNYG